MKTGFTEVLDFWFGPPAAACRGRPRREWFRKDDAFDAQIRRRFLTLYEDAFAADFSHWERTPFAALALVIVLDQFPRNMFRGEARAFAADARALQAARRLLERGFEAALLAHERTFAYLPFEHCEDLAVQRRSVALFTALGGGDAPGSALDYARRHYEVIARFGRFPHRNAALGRASTPQEIEFLARPGSAF
ncbi:MAG: DUF924 domain-containing protein [Burkholderiales bacterium]|nr:DUF924 domain-containing protein [Burkholderiales bacterium]